MIYVIIGLAIAITTYILCFFYRKVALKKGVIADLNSRTLHDEATPKGGGIIFPIIFAFLLLLFLFFNIKFDTKYIFVSILALSLSIFGLWDDYRDVSAAVKFAIQAMFSFFILVILLPIEIFLSVNLYLFLSAFVLLLLIWVLNSINFMDGIDGLASSLCFFYFFSTFLISYIQDPSEPHLKSFIIFSICLGFLAINFSKTNNLFMGDAGSLFLGFMLCFIAIETIYNESLSILYWSILLSYCLTETTLTTLYRILYIDKWYKAHRSHAYQNLARISNNHWKITVLILLYHLIWLFPLAYLSIFSTINSLYLIILSIIPTLIFNMTFGPRFSSS
tara:strand:+ start:71 stop:1075 length:1005 start_codon:yes stop_codon:yes gene_type:complete